MRNKITAITFVICLLFSGIGFASPNTLPLDVSGVAHIQVMNPTAIITIAAAGDVSVQSYKVVMFDEDVDVYFNGDSSNTYRLPANTPLGVDHITSIHISVACSMLVM